MTTQSLSPIETFMRDYLPEAGGAWDQVEPQVYDLLLPETPDEPEPLVRVAFDPDALPEHPGSRFMTLGTPLVDALLSDARRRGRFGRAYLNGLNLYPFALDKDVRRSLELPAKATLELAPSRAMEVILAMFWFEATFASDQKEQAMFHAAVDLHQLRPVRHLEQLMDEAALDDAPVQTFESAPHAPRRAGYALAREQVAATVAAAANPRRRELERRAERQQARMARYYQDLLTESDERLTKALRKDQDPTKEHHRRRSIEQERDIRLAEVRKKASLRVQLRLTNLLEIHQPKLILHASLHAPARSEPVPLTLTWDPLIHALEPPACPRCARPGFALRLPPRQSNWCCPACTKS